MSDERMPMPPASFEFLVYSLRAQAEMNMGLFEFEAEEGAPEPDLEAARLNIDLLGVIQEKTKGNLSLDEELMVNNTIAELRFHFVQIAGAASDEDSRIIRPSDDAPRIIIP